MASDQSTNATGGRLLERLKDGSEVAKNLVSLLRDVSIVALLIVFLANADLLKQWMQSNDIESLSLMGVLEVKAQKAVQESAAALDATATVQQETRSAAAALQKLSAERPELKPQLDGIAQSLAQSEQKASQASETIASAGIKQQQVLAQAVPARPAAQGWVSRNFLRGDGDLRAGETATVIPPRPLNLRSGPGTTNRTQGILFPGTRVRILEGPEGNWVRVTAERAN